MKRILTATVLILAVFALIFFGQLWMITLFSAIVAELAERTQGARALPATLAAARAMLDGAVASGAGVDQGTAAALAAAASLHGKQRVYHWRGYGLITVPAAPVLPIFYAVNADNVEWDHVDINFTTNSQSSSPFACGIGWFAASDSATHHHVKVTNSHVSNSSWGISIFYNNGSGSLTDVEIANNTVRSPSTYTNWDGIHVDGAVTNIKFMTIQLSTEVTRRFP